MQHFLTNQHLCRRVVGFAAERWSFVRQSEHTLPRRRTVMFRHKAICAISSNIWEQLETRTQITLGPQSPRLQMLRTHYFPTWSIQQNLLFSIFHLMKRAVRVEMKSLSVQVVWWLAQMNLADTGPSVVCAQSLHVPRNENRSKSRCH